MRVKDLGSRPASASIREFFSRMGRRSQPVVPIERRQIPYWQERGWQRNGNRYAGSYQTPFGAFEGLIDQERSGHLSFFLYSPSELIRRHSHWTCFQDRSNDWYLIHMAKEPQDISSGIITIEKLITEAYRK